MIPVLTFSQTYVADIFLAQSWRDHRLRLPENMTEEYRILDVGWLQNIWRPDVFFKNAKQGISFIDAQNKQSVFLNNK